MQFFRYIFLISIVMGCTSIGFLLSKSSSDRVKELKALLKSINILKNKIRFTHKPLSDLFYEVANIKDEQKISKIFKKTADKLKDKTSEKAWNEAFQEERIFLNLKNEDINLINTFGIMLGKTDIDGQMSEIDSFSILLEERIKKAEEESSKNGKMYKSLGTIIGLAIVIILF